jgi:hypothetical protein
MTGHANGVITILLREADSALREQMRKQFLEPYRTLIGHLRHEVGLFWDRLIYSNKALKEYRAIFEIANYGDSLQNYYKKGAPQIGKSHLLVSMLHHILGKIGPRLALSAYYGYVRNSLFFWFECQTHRYE